MRHWSWRRVTGVTGMVVGRWNFAKLVVMCPGKTWVRLGLGLLRIACGVASWRKNMGLLEKVFCHVLVVSTW